MNLTKFKNKDELCIFLMINAKERKRTPFMGNEIFSFEVKIDIMKTAPELLGFLYENRKKIGEMGKSDIDREGIFLFFKESDQGYTKSLRYRCSMLSERIFEMMEKQSKPAPKSRDKTNKTPLIRHLNGPK